MLAAAAVVACLQATAECTEKLEFGPTGRFMTVFRTHDLKAPNPSVTRAMVMIHGTARNGDGYFRTILASAAAAGALADSVLVSPHFKGNDGRRCRDQAATGELTYPCDGWKQGENATNLSAGQTAYSFDAVDRLVELFNDTARFPNLRTITIAGHSAGGQFLHRYIASSRVTSRLPVRYFVANPSSYLYLDEYRLPHRARCQADGTCTAPFEPYSDADTCTGFQRYRYGFLGRTGYASATSDADLKANLLARDVTYLAGAQDTLEESSLDTGCGARAQGPNRRERALNYHAYLRQRFPAASPRLIIVNGCGHSATCMFASEAAALALFAGPRYVTLRAPGYEAVINPQAGGELASFKTQFRGQWIETLYRALDYSPTTGWTGRAPLLWPATGRNIPDPKWSGEPRPMPIHGFARDHAWRLASSSANTARLVFAATPETRKSYPYAFELTVNYTLSASGLEIAYQVKAGAENQGAMPFAIGNHITFRTPLVTGSDPLAMTFVSPSTVEYLKEPPGVPNGKSQPRSYAKPERLGAIDSLVAISLGGYASEPFMELRDPAGLTLRMDQTASSAPEGEPLVRFNVWGDPKNGYFSPEPWVGLQNSFNRNQGMVRLEPGRVWNWKITLRAM